VGAKQPTLTDRLLGAYRAPRGYFDPSAWWRDPELRADLVTALAALHEDGLPTVVAGIESRGQLLGALVAQQLGLGFVEIRKDQHPEHVGEPLLRQTTPPDYHDRGLLLTMRRGLVQPRDRVLLVDDWIETGGQAAGARALVDDAEASWVGVAVIVDALPSARRRALGVRALLRVGQLPD
jgi:adenine phosphoribosyltransferase